MDSNWQFFAALAGFAAIFFAAAAIFLLITLRRYSIASACKSCLATLGGLATTCGAKELAKNSKLKVDLGWFQWERDFATLPHAQSDWNFIVITIGMVLLTGICLAKLK